jgi:glyceraldehyde 3-phosphate dehydrogenase
MLKIAINGFGRIGRGAFKVAVDHHKSDVDVVGINDLTDAATLTNLLKYDSAYGTYEKNVSSSGNNIIVEGKKYPICAEKEPAVEVLVLT